MDPPFGKSNVYTRLTKLIKETVSSILSRIRKVRFPKPTFGGIWLRLSYFENRLHRLDEESQEIFIDNFYHSVRQVNYMTLLIILVIILTFITTLEFQMIGFLEGLAIEGLLAFSLFYLVWYYRMGMEDLMDYLIRQETVPDYAFRPRLGPRQSSRPPFGKESKKASGTKARKRD